MGQTLVKNIRRLLDLHWSVEVPHMYREINARVDALANIGYNLKFDSIFFSTYSESD